MENFLARTTRAAATVPSPFFRSVASLTRAQIGEREGKRSKIDMSNLPSSPHTERRSSHLEDRPAGRTAADGRATRPHPGGGQEPPASWSTYHRPASHQAPAASVCRRSLQMDDQGMMIDFGIQGLDDHEFSQMTTKSRPNIGHHQYNGTISLILVQVNIVKFNHGNTIA